VRWLTPAWRASNSASSIAPTNDRSRPQTSQLICAVGRDGVAVALCVLAVTTGLAGCADTTSGTFRTKSGYEETFKSAVEALNSVGFSVQSSDVSTGVLSGEKTALVRWYGRTTTSVRINVTVKRAEARAELEIVVVPPEFAYGSTKLIFDDYVYALRSKVDGLVMVSMAEG